MPWMFMESLKVRLMRRRRRKSMPWMFMESLKVRLMRRRRRKSMPWTFMESLKVARGVIAIHPKLEFSLV